MSTEFKVWVVYFISYLLFLFTIKKQNSYTFYIQENIDSIWIHVDGSNICHRLDEELKE